MGCREFGVTRHSDVRGCSIDSARAWCLHLCGGAINVAVEAGSGGGQSTRSVVEFNDGIQTKTSVDNPEETSVLAIVNIPSSQSCRVPEQFHSGS